MRIVRKYLVLASLAAPLFLAACGEGYEIRAYHGTPYAKNPFEEGRTAGSGVEYVRASLMPRRELNVVMEQPDAVLIKDADETLYAPVVEATPAEEIFQKMIGK